MLARGHGRHHHRTPHRPYKVRCALPTLHASIPKRLSCAQRPFGYRPHPYYSLLDHKRCTMPTSNPYESAARSLSTLVVLCAGLAVLVGIFSRCS